MDGMTHRTAVTLAALGLGPIGGRLPVKNCLT